MAKPLNTLQVRTKGIRLNIGLDPQTYAELQALQQAFENEGLKRPSISGMLRYSAKQTFENLKGKPIRETYAQIKRIARS
jgi:hypothetical protein